MPVETIALAPSNATSFEHEDKEAPAFTILQKDGLDSTLPMLHVSEDDEDDGLRIGNARNHDLYARRRISKSNDHLVLASLQGQQANPILKKRHSRSQGNLTHERLDRDKSSMALSTEDFNEVLNAKLRKIQEEGEYGHRGRKTLYTGNNNSFISRKPFITVVKTGEFLLPPPEVASLLGITLNNNHPANGNNDEVNPRSKFRPLASIAKRPGVRHESHHSRCHAALKATTDFSVGLVSSVVAEGDHARTKRDLAQIGFPARTPRAFPKKLEPIGGTTNVSKDEGDHPVPFGNIMFDRRVVRGSTYASAPMLMDCEQSQAARQAEARRKHMARRRNQEQSSRAYMLRSGSPPPVPGRKHEPVQTEVFLEELFEKPPESEIGTQTDLFLDRPATPMYCPAKVGQDACTQIFPGDLFDFDIEVQPILEVLVGKTIEQSLIEVLEEEEIAALREQQRRFLELRAAEKAEAQRLEEQERRLRDEKCRRLRQHEEAMRTQQETEDRVAAAVLLTGYIAELLPAVLEGLKMSGFLLDEIKADVEEGFMPWLMKEVKKEMGSMIESRELLMEIVREILENRAETYRHLGEEYDASREVETPKDDELEEGGGRRDIEFVNYEPQTIGSPDGI